MKKLLFLVLFMASITCISPAAGQELKTIPIERKTDMHEFFRYAPSREIIISGHRGGMDTGYPENCIESFEHTLKHLPSFFEIDPRLTKDSVIVLMHDRTIDRTTNGTGKVSDYTYAELQKFRLVDREGNLTDFTIPTLEEAIEWSRGRTVLNLDKKDVPLEMTAHIIESTGAQNIMLTVHSAREAQFYFDLDNEAMFSAHILSMEAFEEYDNSGIPWNRFIAYVGRTINSDNRKICDLLHRRGVMCMISVAPTHDTVTDPDQRLAGYRDEMERSPDIIETDYPILFLGL